ncbi:MAG: hypothetical protein ACFHXK_02390 [bacterium]
MRNRRFFCAQQYLWLLGSLLLIPSMPVSAAQASLSRPFEDAVDIVISVLESSGITIQERADTDRFVILYAQGDAQGETQRSIAVTLFALPRQTDRMTLTVNSASPADEHFDHQLLQSIRARLLEDP